MQRGHCRQNGKDDEEADRERGQHERGRNLVSKLRRRIHGWGLMGGFPPHARPAKPQADWERLVTHLAPRYLNLQMKESPGKRWRADSPYGARAAAVRGYAAPFGRVTASMVP